MMFRASERCICQEQCRDFGARHCCRSIEACLKAELETVMAELERVKVLLGERLPESTSITIKDLEDEKSLTPDTSKDYRYNTNRGLRCRADEIEKQKICTHYLRSKNPNSHWCAFNNCGHDDICRYDTNSD